MKNVILSICIPTYNRASVLRDTLQHYVRLPLFNADKIELVISDNASTDETEQVCKSFAKRYPENIHYFRNATNVEDENFHIALSRGSGNFLKLNNDTLRLSGESLSQMLKTIEQYQSTKPLLYFRQEAGPQAPILCSTVDEFYSRVGHMCTWIAEFGIWKSDFEAIHDFSRARKTKLIQADVTLRVLKKKKQSLITYNIQSEITHSSRVGGYNPAEIFGQYFFDIVNPYFDDGLISKDSYERSKWRVFRYTILSNFLTTAPWHRFSKGKYFKYLWREYKYKWYLYAGWPFVMVARIIAPIRRLINK